CRKIDKGLQVSMNPRPLFCSRLGGYMIGVREMSTCKPTPARCCGSGKKKGEKPGNNATDQPNRNKTNTVGKSASTAPAVLGPRRHQTKKIAIASDTRQWKPTVSTVRRGKMAMGTYCWRM